MDGRPQRPPERWEDRPGGDLLGAGPWEQDGHGHPRPPEVLRAGGRQGRALERVCAGVCVCVCVRRLGVGPMGCLGGCHRGPGCAGLRMCVTVGLWQEPCPTRCSWRSAEYGELGALLAPSSGKGVMSRPATPGVGERVKWPGGPGALVNLSEAHTTFVLGCGACVTCSGSGFFLDMCVDMHLISFTFYTRCLWIFWSLSVCTYPLKLCIIYVLCLWICRYACIYVQIFV